jgi:hypothetical protein
MKLALVFATIPLVLGWSSTTIPPIFSVTCTLGNPCPTGSICTQTETCGGLCLVTQVIPPVIPCTVGNNGPCPTGSTCTPTVICPPTSTSCGGQCIATPTTPVVISCTVGNNGPCPTGSTCTPTVFCPPTSTSCGGQCIATPTSLKPCVVGADDCPSGSICTQTMVCGGLCIPTSVPSPTSTARPCGGHHHKPHCPDNFKCVRHHGKNCGPDSQCHGVCVPQ